MKLTETFDYQLYTSSDFVDKFTSFIDRYADAIDKFDVDNIVECLFTPFGVFDDANSRDNDPYIAFSLISNEWLKDGLNPLTKCRSVPQFYGSCIEQDTIIIPGNTISIDRNAFCECKAKRIVLENGVKRIHPQAFMDCYNLECVTFPSTLTLVEHDAFMNCTKLHKVEAEDVNSLFSIEYDQFAHPFQYSRGGYFYHKGKVITDLVTPSNILEVKNSVFLNCKSLRSLHVTGNIRYLCFNAFNGCANLKTVELDDGIQYIESGVFHQCTMLEYVEIPKSIDSITTGAFDSKVKLHRYK